MAQTQMTMASIPVMAGGPKFWHTLCSSIVPDGRPTVNTIAKIMKANALAALCVIALVFCTGCGTVFSSLDSGMSRKLYPPYGGVRLDANAVGEGGWGLVLALDVPVSLVADTLVLPIGLHNLTLQPPKVDPLAGWNSWGEYDEESHPAVYANRGRMLVQQAQPAKHSPLDKSIKDDYQGYLNKHEPGYFPDPLSLTFHEDGAGNHAVRITIGRNGYYWVYTFMYDKNNVRTEIIRYTTGGYAC
jgi:uncharacterized protein YceK